MRNGILITALAGLFFLLTFCTRNTKTVTEESPWLNQNDTVQYVGMETCRLCHADKHTTFIHTGMGMSFDRATKEKSAAVYDTHAIVYDSINNFWYKPYWKGDVLQIMEFRLDGADTIHKRIETVSYIIGSGQHTNSHLISVNGYVYQAPVTFYTQKKKWDMAPGMESGFNSRFSRIIETECMNCHNGLPEIAAGSVNKYTKVPSGIDCERCHGPGSLHVARVSNNMLVDTSRETDYSIVNPRKLPVDLQNELCMRCHLQGVNVLNTNAGFFDFKPGDKISDHWNIFLPRFDGANDKFLMASQADRLLQSKCFIASGKISCITCHNPHISVKQTPVAQFNQPCIRCHTAPQTVCTEKQDMRDLTSDNCSGCHIPKSGAIDIPHVSISDHKIQIPGKEKEKRDGSFTGLKCMTAQNPDPLTMALGYLQYYESFNHDSGLLDSAFYYIQKADNKKAAAAKIHYYYLRGDFNAIIKTISAFNASGTGDMWTCYRIGEAYLSLSKYPEAEKWLQKAADIQPLNLDFIFKLATAQVFNGKVEAGEKMYAFILSENPEYYLAWNNLGVIQKQRGRVKEAEESFIRVIQLDPDYLNARLQLTELYISSRQKSKAGKELDYLRKYYPDAPEVQQLLLLYRSI